MTDSRFWMAALCLALVAGAGCNSPYYADRGAAFGAGTGALAGAVIADAAGKNAGAGAVLGGALGAITGATVGGAMDEQEARNRALIEAQLGQQVAAGAVTIDDVVTMAHSGVEDELIINHVRANGMAQQLGANELIYLKQQNISPRVISVMQAPPARPVQQTTVIREVPAPPPPRPVVVERNYWGPGCYHPHYHPRNRVHWGVSFFN